VSANPSRLTPSKRATAFVTFLVCAFTSLGASAALASPRVIVFPSIGTPSHVVISGRVLKHVGSEGSSPLSKNLRRLAASNWEGASVEVRYAGQAVTVTSGHDGDFEADFSSAADGGVPYSVGTSQAEARVSGADTGAAPVEIMPPDAPYFVVSDFDDTIAVTNVLKTRKMIEAALLEDGDTQPAVEGMPAFYKCLRAVAASAPSFDVVSGSPEQYSARIATFLKKNEFPFAALNLRNIGPSTLSNYKQPIIRALMKRIPGPVVLIGDSGEHDPEVYSEIRSEFPGRVKAVYIRNAGHADDPKRFSDMLLFAHPGEAARDAAAKGLAEKACVEKAFPEEKKKAP
jgi:phosphatidate phosphatase APP1